MLNITLMSLVLSQSKCNNVFNEDLNICQLFNFQCHYAGWFWKYAHAILNLSREVYLNTYLVSHLPIIYTNLITLQGIFGCIILHVRE